MMDAATKFNVVMREGVPVVQIKGDLDHYNTPAFRTIITDLIDKGHTKIVADMAGVEFMDSGGMSGIVFAIKRLSPLGGHISLKNCNRLIARKFEIGGLTKLSEVLEVCPSAEKAEKVPKR
jgi:anti-anti-sigma factor